MQKTLVSTTLDSFRFSGLPSTRVARTPSRSTWPSPKTASSSSGTILIHWESFLSWEGESVPFNFEKVLVNSFDRTNFGQGDRLWQNYLQNKGGGVLHYYYNEFTSTNAHLCRGCRWIWNGKLDLRDSGLCDCVAFF